MGEADFNQFMRLRNQLVNAAEDVDREENLSSVLIPTMSKDLVEQSKMAYRVVDIMNRVNKKIGVTLLRCNVDNPESSYDQVRLFASRNES